MRLLAVNGDDGGLHIDRDDTILRCAAEGVLRNATAVMSGPTTQDFLRRATDAGIDVGLHVNLTNGLAMAGPASTLTDSDGHFLQPKSVIWKRATADGLDVDEIRVEIKAQLEAFRLSGMEPSHVDGHNHVHLFPPVREVLAELLPDVWFRTPVDPGFDREIPDFGKAFGEWSTDRSGPWMRTDGFAGHSFCFGPTVEVFISSLDLSNSVTEFMVHPGQRPGSSFTSSDRRALEAEVLCSEQLKVFLDRNEFELVTFTEARRRCE